MSPMLDIQRRHAEVFRLRFGERNGNAPRKLTDAIRVTSHGRDIVEAFTAVYGGEISEWASPKGPAWEAKLPTTEVSIMVLPGQSLTQWWERYRGSVCDRRCDGFTEQLSDGPCLCPTRDPAARASSRDECSPMTRVNVLCPDVEVVGAGAFVTHGMVAAETLPQSIMVAEAALARGLLVPAMLRVVEHKGRRHFIVPQIEIVGVTLGALTTGETNGRAVAGGRTELAPPPRAAISAGNTEKMVDPYKARPQPPLPHEIDAVSDPKGDDPAASTGGGDTSPNRPSPPPGPNADDDRERKARQVASWCRKAKLTRKDERRTFLRCFSQGRYESSYDVPDSERDQLETALRMFGEGRLVMDADDDPVLLNASTRTIWTGVAA